MHPSLWTHCNLPTHPTRLLAAPAGVVDISRSRWRGFPSGSASQSTGGTHSQAGGIIRSEPAEGTSASGIRTEPAGCWEFSRIATRGRPTARPGPLSVWTNSGFAFGVGLYRILARRAWKSSKLEQEEISRKASWLGSQTSRSYVLAAEKPMSQVARQTTR